MVLDLGAVADLDLITPADVSPESWANGLGVTRVLAKRLGWRLSIAELRGRTPFSAFPGMDRVLIPLSEAVVLEIDGVEHRVTRESGIRFAGEAPVSAIGGRDSVSVVNLVVRRGLAEPAYRIAEHIGEFRIDPAATFTVLLAGEATLDALPLPPGSVLLPSPRERVIRCHTALAVRFDLTPSGDAPRI